MMNRHRTDLYADILEKQIQIEDNEPDVIVTLNNETPIPENILTHSKEIFHETYKILRESLDVPAKLYNSALETITDFVNLFGNDFVDFEDLFRVFHVNSLSFEASF